MQTLPELLGDEEPFRWRGAVIVEFALILTLVTTIVFGSVEFVSLLNDRLTLEAAARDGARRAAIAGGDVPYVRERIARQLEMGELASDRIEVAIDPWVAPYGHSIRVRITYDSPTITPVGRLLVGESVRLSTEVLTRSEKVR